ncbi:MAG: hypothetical protein ACKVU1_09005 [bacterium]
MGTSARRISAAIKRYDAARQIADRRAADVLAIASQLGAAAVTKRDDLLVSQLIERALLRDVLAFHVAMAMAPLDTLPPDLERLRLLPAALLDWLDEAFGLTCMGIRSGAEIPARNLAGQSCSFDVPRDPNALVKVFVDSDGWNKRGKAMVPARLSRADRSS